MPAGRSLQSTLRALREPRYATLSALMAVVALVCIGAGGWQVARFDGKVHANDQLRANFRSAPVPVASVLATTGERNQPSVDAVAYRTVRATGRYDAAGQRLLRNQSQGGVNGFDVITPLRTGTAVLLIDRGFVAADRNGNPPTAVPAPPTGPVTVDARVQPGSGRRDTAARGQIEAVNPSAQAGRLHAAVYTDYAHLLPGQPGTAGLRPKPRPSLYNPAGGAVEPQHFAYVIQWFLFALLALAAPFAMIRADRRDRSDDDPEPTTALSPEEARAARLADRYGRAIR